MKISIPKNVTNAILAEFAQPHEMWLVRVLLRGVVNRTDYTLRGKNRVARVYKAKYDTTLRCHTLDIPLSVWTDGIPDGTYRDNDSVMHDIMGGRGNTLLPVITHIVPFPGSEARHAAFAALMENPQADTLQEIVLRAAAGAESAGESLPAELPVNLVVDTKTTGKSAAERMAAMRERKKQLATQEPATA